MDAFFGCDHVTSDIRLGKLPVRASQKHIGMLPHVPPVHRYAELSGSGQGKYSNAFAPSTSSKIGVDRIRSFTVESSRAILRGSPFGSPVRPCNIG
jgi:hypothetical protein